MATNNILPFADAAVDGTDIDTQAVYAGEYPRTHGVQQGGAAQRQIVNKALKQSSLLSAAVAQVIVDQLTVDVADTQSVSVLAARIKSAIQGYITGQANTWTASQTFSGSALRLIGDFSNAAVLNRTLLQTSASNATTSIGIVPSGSGTRAGVACYSASDPTNASTLILVVDTAAGEAQVSSNVTGTGTMLPIALKTSNTTKFLIGTVGQLGIGGATYGTTAAGARQALVSGGASGAPIWYTTGQYEEVWTGSATSVAMSALSCGMIPGRYVIRRTLQDVPFSIDIPDVTKRAVGDYNLSVSTEFATYDYTTHTLALANSEAFNTIYRMT